jgi:hypothetical protein
MKVDTRPFPGVNMMEDHRDTGERSARHRLDFLLDVNMAGPPRRGEGGQSLLSALERRKEVHHRRTGETCAVSAASLRASAQEI